MQPQALLLTFLFVWDSILLFTAAHARLGSGLLGILLSPLLVPPDPRFTIGALGHTVSVVDLFQMSVWE